MNRRLALSILVALGGCTPVAYVPAPIPAAPRAGGVWASGTVNGLAAQATGEIAVAPVSGVAVFGRGLYGNTVVLSSQDGAGAYVQRGVDLGAVASVPLSPRAAVELGAAVGRDRMDAQDGTFDVGCCSQTFRSVEVTTDRVGGHVGLWLGAPDGVQLGPALRVTQVSSRTREIGADTSVGLFAEPAFRLRTQRGPVDLTAQVGLSLPIGAAYRERFSHVPFVGGVGVAYRLSSFGD